MKNPFFYFLLSILLYCKKDNKVNFTNPSNINFERAKELKKTSLDSSYIYFNLAKNDFLLKSDSIGAARSLINMAIIQSDRGDYYGSIETSLEADKYLKTSSDNNFVEKLYSSNYNNLAISSKSLKKYNDAEKYYQNALNITTDPKYQSVINNNIGDVLIMQNKPGTAIKYLQKALDPKDSISYARVLNNLGKAKFLENINYNSIPELEEALKIREAQKDTLGLNSSFATLADYFYNKDKNKSLLYAKMMLHRASKNKSPDDQLEALEKIIKLEPQNYLNNFFKFQRINDSLQIARNQAKNQFAVIRYDVEQKNADNQILKNKNLQKNIGLVALGLILIGGSLYYKKRKKRLQQEKELEVKKTEIRYSKKVHDKVANKVYHVMSEVENNAEMDRNDLLDRLETIYHISRDISYEDQYLNLEENFAEQLSEMLKSYSSETRKIITIGNEKELWNQVENTSKAEIFYILQELMTNMKKHSQADKVIINFEKENSLIHIIYSDNGIGIPSLSPKNGLQNTETRIKSISGTINFDTKAEEGLKITILFPVKN